MLILIFACSKWTDCYWLQSKWQKTQFPSRWHDYWYRGQFVCSLFWWFKSRQSGSSVITSKSLTFLIFSKIRFTLTNTLFSRQGNILLEIPIPAKQITSVAFGGPNLDILYVTCASLEISAGPVDCDLSDMPSELAGRLFKVTGLNAKGFPGNKVRV